MAVAMAEAIVNLQSKMTLANGLKEVAVKMGLQIGVTIIVHELDPGAGDASTAVATTLPSRAHQRALLAEVVAQSVLADGYDAESAAAVVAADHAAYIGESKG